MAKSEAKGFDKIKNAVTGWFKNVPGEIISSKKTIFAGVSGYILVKIALKSIDNHPGIAYTAIIMAGVCFLGWIAAQTYTDGKRIQRGTKQ